MKFTLAWLKDHLDTTAPVREIVDTLTAIGLEVEGVVDRAADLAPFTVARVIEARPHPNADRLRVCTVDTGDGGNPVEVVCGAPNARTGMTAIYAPVGSTLPGTGLTLKAASIRGVASHGMLCSERELGLSDEHDGIVDLETDVPAGGPAAQALGLDDPMIEIAITPNRPDCLGVRGVARDLAAAGIGTLRPLATDPLPGRFPSPVPVDIRFDPDDTAACPCFVGRYIRGVRNGPSPRWLQQRLRAIGLRPISALVDMTNYITFDLARPLHVFDADTLSGGIHVRFARDGEAVAALNDRTYTLDPSVTVIADNDGALGLGGVIGGESSGCTADTVNVFIEAALFDPLRTAATGRRYAIESDARYRFERGVDPMFVVDGMEIATRMVLELCGGEPSELVVAGTLPAWHRAIPMRPSRVHHLAGIDLPEAETCRILQALGFAVERSNGDLRVSVPSWRGDVHGEADLVEEVARIRGFDAIPSVPLVNPSPVTRPVLTAVQRRERDVRRTLATRGMVEAVTWSFTGSDVAARFGAGTETPRLANPISSDLDVMRPGLLPNLALAAARNAARGFTDLALFEVGAIYPAASTGSQRAAVAGLRTGQTLPRHWRKDARGVDPFDVKADALAALGAAGAPVAGLQVTAGAADWYHPGRSGEIRLGPRTVLGQFGELHPAQVAALGLPAPAMAFEVFLDAVPPARGRKGYARAALRASDLPEVSRDFAFVVDAGIAAGDVVRAAASADRALITEVTVFDVFAGGSLGDGRKSVAISVRLTPTERTLTDAEIDGVASRIVDAVGKATGASLRG
jgi:phenylalanyl-tRNA synthetase beta chain